MWLQYAWNNISFQNSLKKRKIEQNCTAVSLEYMDLLLKSDLSISIFESSYNKVFNISLSNCDLLNVKNRTLDAWIFCIEIIWAEMCIHYYALLWRDEFVLSKV